MNLNTCMDHAGVIKACKKKHKLRTSDVAEYLGTDYHTVFSWERGKKIPIYINWKVVINKMIFYDNT